MILPPNCRTYIAAALFLLIGFSGCSRKSEPDQSEKNVQGADQLLRESIANNDDRAAAKALKKGADINTPDDSGLLPLACALSHDSLAVAAVLLEQGASPEVLHSAGIPWLHHAVAVGRNDIASLLLKHKANPEALDHQGRSPLSLAAQAKSGELVELLLQSGARPDPSSDSEQSALAWSLAHRELSMLDRLLRAGADPNRPIRTPASDAFINSVNVESFTYYLRKESGVTPLMLASVTGQLDAVEALLNTGADKRSMTSKHRTTAIWLAGRQNHVRVVQRLLGVSTRASADSLRIEISLSSQQALLLRDNQEIFRSPISSGREGYRTPIGEFIVTNKHAEWYSTLYDNAPMPFFLRLNCGPVGLHAGQLPGYPASHGCIRLPYENAQKLFSKVPVGTLVTIKN